MPPVGFVYDPQVGIHLNPQFCPPHLTSAFQFSNDSLAATPVDAEINIIVHDPTLGSTTSEMIDIDLRSLEKEGAKDLESGSITALSIYTGSTIYTMSETGIVEEFIVSKVKVALGLTPYILAYGIGPKFLPPLQEMASYGCNPMYIIGLVIFDLFNVLITSRSTSRSGSSPDLSVVLR